jgi:hypothetical protein
MISRSEAGIAVSHSFLKIIKHEINYSAGLSEKIASASCNEDIKQAISDHFRSRYTDDELNQAISEFIEEHTKLISDPGVYLNDNDGKAIMKVTNDMIYHPAPTTREDGSVISLKPMVHPKVLSTLALVNQEKAWLKELSLKHGLAPTEHMRSPWKIIEKATFILCENGLVASSEDIEDVAITNYELGHEHIAGVFQSMNPKFIRSSNFSAVLCREIMSTRKKNFYFKSIKADRNSSERWFTVQFKVW